MNARDATRRHARIVILILWALFVRPAAAWDSPGPDGSPVSMTLRIDATVELLAHGDATGRIVLTVPPDRYEAVRRMTPDPRVMLRELRPARSDDLIADSSRCRYDDASTSIVMDLIEHGAVRNEGDGQWSLEVEDVQRFLNFAPDDSGRTTALFLVDMEPDQGVTVRGQVLHTLPAGATDARWDAARRLLRYRLPYAGPRGQGRLDVTFHARDRLMGCLYKVYGLGTDYSSQWVAKAVFRNEGGGPLFDLRLRYRVAGYSEWSMWEKFPELVPGQTAVSVFYPVLDDDMARLSSTTPTNVLMEWTWRDVSGREHADGAGKRIRILGAHEFVFSNLGEDETTGNWYDANSNAPFIAAWVPRDDPVVKQFAALANKNAGGQGAIYSDDAAVAVLEACYELMQINDFTYQGPVAVRDAGMSFDNKSVQSIKFPRDVVRDRSGTCIELTVLYAAMAHAVGLKPYVVIVPGHAFPLIELPEGGVLPVETTGVGGGRRFGSTPFAEVVERAGATLKEAVDQGLFIAIDVRDAWTRGVSSPELEPVPADILQRWGISGLPPDGGNRTAVVQRGPQRDPQVQRESRRDQAPGPLDTDQRRAAAPVTDGLVGVWHGTCRTQMPDGSVLGFPIVIEITGDGRGGYRAIAVGELQVRDGYGSVSTWRIEETFVGRAQHAQLHMQGQRKLITSLDTGQQMFGDLDELMAATQDGQLVGRIGNWMEGYSEFSAARRR